MLMVWIIHMRYIDDVWMIKTQVARANVQIRWLWQFWQACEHEMQKLIFSLACVDFMFQTSSILILKHVRHQITQGFSQVFKNARFLQFHYVS